MSFLNLLSSNSFFSKNFIALFQDFTIFISSFETIYMTVISVVIAYLIGLPLGIILAVTDENGIYPIKWLNTLLGIIVNVFRSIPFLILMLALMPLASFILKDSTGNPAMILMLVIASAPYIARMVESSAKEVNGGVLEAAKSMGANTWQIVYKVILPESVPSLIIGAVISTVTVFGYTAMSYAIGGTGLGALAFNEGYVSSDWAVIWTCVLFMVIIVQLVQVLGMKLATIFDKRISKK